MTDAKVMRTKSGKTRCFGFVGFRTEADAASALDALNNTFIGSSKMNVAFAHARGDDRIQRPWSKYSEGSSRFEVVNVERKGKKGAAAEEGGDSDGADGEMEEAAEAAAAAAAAAAGKKGGTDNDELLKSDYMAVMSQRSKVRSWANDTGDVGDAPVEFDESGWPTADGEDEDAMDEDGGLPLVHLPPSHLPTSPSNQPYQPALPTSPTSPISHDPPNHPYPPTHHRERGGRGGGRLQVELGRVQLGAFGPRLPQEQNERWRWQR